MAMRPRPFSVETETLEWWYWDETEMLKKASRPSQNLRLKLQPWYLALQFRPTPHFLWPCICAYATVVRLQLNWSDIHPCTHLANIITKFQNKECKLLHDTYAAFLWARTHVLPEVFTLSWEVSPHHQQHHLLSLTFVFEQEGTRGDRWLQVQTVQDTKMSHHNFFHNNIYRPLQEILPLWAKQCENHLEFKNGCVPAQQRIKKHHFWTCGYVWTQAL